MSHIGNIVVMLSTMYAATTMGAAKNRTAIKADSIPSKNSLDSKLVEFTDEFNKETKVDTRIKFKKNNNYFVFDEAKKIKDSFVNYFKDIVNFSYKKLSRKPRKEYRTVMPTPLVFNKDESPLITIKKLVLRFYLMLPTEYDPNNHSYLNQQNI